MEHKATIEEITWNDAKKEIKDVNAELYEVIEDISPGKDFTLFKARYTYGTRICDYGVFNVPCDDGSIAPIDSDKIPANIREALSYNPLPVALVIKNNVEVFSELDNRFVPIELFMAGTIFGTWEIFDSPQTKTQTQNWSFSAGARSVFMLPKITNDRHHRKLLAKYRVSPSSPKFLADQHDLFKKIANHSAFEEQWGNEIIFFPAKWIDKARNSTKDSKWIAFQHALLKEAWKYTSNWRHQLSIDINWQPLKLEMEKKNMQVRPYLVDTIKHLISVALGTALAFCPAVESDAIPLDGMQKAYLNDYGIKEYIPTIMQPCYLRDYDKPVYYSLQHPTLLSYPQSGFRSTMKDLQDVQYLMDMLLYQLKKEEFSIYSLIEHVKFDYFHSEANKYGYDVKLTTEIPKEDSRFSQMCDQEKSDDMVFANNASFLRGCVRITKTQP